MNNEEMIKYLIIAVVIWYFFIRDKDTYDVPSPPPARVDRSGYKMKPVVHVAKEIKVDSTNLLANQSKYNSKEAQAGQALYTSDIRGNAKTSRYESPYISFTGPDGSIGPGYPDASFRGIAISDERGPAPMPNAPVMGETTAPAALPIRVRDTTFDSSWSLNRMPQ